MPAHRPKSVFVCQQCGSQSPRWLGRCPDCGQWNSLVEAVEPAKTPTRPVLGMGTAPQSLAHVETNGFHRLTVPFEEFNRVLGGGIVPGSVVLLGGDPGIGKSTLLLQVAAAVADSTRSVLYVSGEESVQQIKLRATRLGIVGEDLLLVSETNLDQIIEHIHNVNPALVIIDSIQTVFLPALTSTAGSVSQVRECAGALLQVAKTKPVPVFLVGHVTKEGTVAGPRVLEHIVDAVLYLEGDRFQSYRLLRGVKNRFGSTNEVGIFEMQNLGMVEVLNPSEVFLAERAMAAPGSAVVVTLEGTRPLLVEVQALVSPSSLTMPRRTVNGFEWERLLILAAVLTKRAGIGLSNQDIYVNVVGGLKIDEPAADLGVALAIASSFKDKPIAHDLVALGEVGLAGELRRVAQVERRLAEALKLGFRRFILPKATVASCRDVPADAKLMGAESVQEAIRLAWAPQ